jgi:hypothetical protein
MLLKGSLGRSFEYLSKKHRRIILFEKAMMLSIRCNYSIITFLASPISLLELIREMPLSPA